MCRTLNLKILVLRLPISGLKHDGKHERFMSLHNTLEHLEMVNLGHTLIQFD